MRRINIILSVVVLVALLGCSVTPSKDKPSENYLAAQEDYNQGIEYDLAGQMRLAEMYYRKAYEAMHGNPSERWRLYGEAGFRYAWMLFAQGDMEGSLAIVGEMMAVAEKADDFPSAQLSNLFYHMAVCEMTLGQADEAKQDYLKAYEARAESVGGEGKGSFNMIVMCDGVFNAYLESGDYDEADMWLRRAEEELTAYGRSEEHDPEIISEYTTIHALYRAQLLQHTGHADEAAAIYDAIPDSCMAPPMCMSTATNYLMTAGRYGEAADIYARLDRAFPDSTSRITLDLINGNLAPRYMANLKAGRHAKALALGEQICSAIDSALTYQKQSDAAELAVIYQTHEKELALGEAQSRARLRLVLLMASVVVMLLILWLLGRTRKYNRQLTEKNRSLYEQTRRREQTEAEERRQMEERPAETLTQSQQLYNRLCEIMKNPAVFTDAETNHETLARLAGTNYTYVYDALHECANLTPADFINQYRIRHAAKLLITTDDPVGLIIEESGITSRSTFSRLFREYYSMSPTEFRRASKLQE